MTLPLEVQVVLSAVFGVLGLAVFLLNIVLTWWSARGMRVPSGLPVFTFVLVCGLALNVPGVDALTRWAIVGAGLVLEIICTVVWPLLLVVILGRKG